MAFTQIPIRFFVATSLIDADSHLMKFCRKLAIIGLRRKTGPDGPSIIQIGYSNLDDFTPNFERFTHTVDNSQPHMMIRQLGQFRRRIFYFLHTANAPLTLEALELELETGAS